VRDLDTLIRARYPLIYLVSWEEQRVEAILESLAQKHGKALMAWSATKGLHRVGGRSTPSDESTRDPLQAIQQTAKLSEPSLVVFKDFHPYLNDPLTVRAVRELAQALKSTYTTALFLSPTLNIPLELEKEVSVVDVPLPTFRDLAQLLREIVAVLRQSKRATVTLTREQAEQMVKAAQGLTLTEAENAFAKAVAADEVLSGEDVALILEEKRQVIRKSGLLEYFPADEPLENVGGLTLLKEWLDHRSRAFSESARKFGIPEPKGILLLGVQGCGKSLTAKAVAAHWKLPLLRLDLGRIFSGLVGSSEENLRKAIRVAEGVAPVVLWIDELEKGLAGSSSSGATDGGVTARVFGALLTWLQEKTAPVFVVATANRIDALPPELLRKGRFDEIFFVDLPGTTERKEIWAIHLRRRGRDPHQFNLDSLAALTDGFSGAELEQALIAALHYAFRDQRELQQADLEKAAQETWPLSVTMKEEIQRLREWARQRTRPASSTAHDGSRAPLSNRFG
jgi:ATP-dependent 26S proteasome regulatory subunit